MSSAERRLARATWKRTADLPPILGEETHANRRQILRALGYGGLLASTGFGSAACAQEVGPSGDQEVPPPGEIPDGRVYAPWQRWIPEWEAPGGNDRYPAAVNEGFAAIPEGRILTPENTAATQNNYYEFLPGRAGAVHRYVGDFEARPWTLRITGEVEEEKTLELDDIARLAPLEERVYRFRCVEAWSMVVPWTGLPLRALIDACKPKSDAKFVKFLSFVRPEQAPGQKRRTNYPWPYYEALRLDEARHPLAMMATGIFGHALPTQHGAPLRVIVPWKYGFKSPKGIVEMQFTKQQPTTFWEDLQPTEYPFLSNVEPDVPHPRWSQERETDLGTGDRIATLPYNGYAEQVADLYR